MFATILNCSSFQVETVTSYIIGYDQKQGQNRPATKDYIFYPILNSVMLRCRLLSETQLFFTVSQTSENRVFKPAVDRKYT